MRSARGLALLHQRKHFVQECGRCGGHALRQRPCVVLRKDLHALLTNDVASIGLVNHVVHGDAGFRLAVHKHPIDGAATAVLGQHAGMQIQATSREQFAHLGANHVAVMEREQKLWLHIANAFEPDGVIKAIRRKHGDSVLGGDACH